MRTLSTLGLVLAAINLIGAAVLVFGRDSGDAATKGIGKGLGFLLATLALVAIVLLLWGRREPARPLAMAAGALLAALPLIATLTLTVSRQGLGLIFPALRPDDRPRVQYAFPDPGSREAALAIIYGDHAKLATILHASPPPDLKSRDERGLSLLGIAVRAAIADGSPESELESLRLLLAAGARPLGNDRGAEGTLLEDIAPARNPNALKAVEMLLDTGLSPDTPMADGRSVLFHPYLTPDLAKLLLARGIDRQIHDTRGGATDWSPVTYQADLRRWETALVLLQGGVPRDHGMPPGSVLARVLRNNEEATDEERGNPAYRSFIAASSKATGDGGTAEDSKK